MDKPSSLRWRVAQWLEIRWWRRYLNKKDKGQYYQKKAQYWRSILRTLEIDIPAQQEILDVGCGPAGIFIIFEDHQVRALDPLFSSYQKVLPHFDPKDYPWVTFENITIEQATGPARKWVFCLNAINHVADWEQGLGKLWELTTEGGTLILSSDVHNYRWLKYIFRLLPGDALHPHQHSREDYLQALERIGLKTQKERILKKGLIFGYWVVILKKDTVA